MKFSDFYITTDKLNLILKTVCPPNIAFFLLQLKEVFAKNEKSETRVHTQAQLRGGGHPPPR